MKSTKVSLIVLILLASLNLVNGNTKNEIEKLSEYPAEWWGKMSEKAKWLYFREAIYQSEVMQKACTQKDKIIDGLKKTVQEDNKLMSEIKPKKYNLMLGAFVSIDNVLNLDIYLHTGFNFILFERFFFGPTANIKLYQNIGGGIGFNLGILF